MALEVVTLVAISTITMIFGLVFLKLNFIGQNNFSAGIETNIKTRKKGRKVAELASRI